MTWAFINSVQIQGNGWHMWTDCGDGRFCELVGYQRGSGWAQTTSGSFLVADIRVFRFSSDAERTMLESECKAQLAMVRAAWLSRTSKAEWPAVAQPERYLLDKYSPAFAC
jgi:hypothetical protein